MPQQRLVQVLACCWLFSLHQPLAVRPAIAQQAAWQQRLAHAANRQQEATKLLAVAGGQQSVAAGPTAFPAIIAKQARLTLHRGAPAALLLPEVGNQRERQAQGQLEDVCKPTAALRG